MRNLILENSALDRLGIVASCVCAAHCVLMPLLIVTLPILGLSFVGVTNGEWLFLAASAVIGGVSLLPAYMKRHRKCRPLLLFGSGFVLLLVARLWLEETQKFEIPIVLIAALLIVTAHFTNLRLCQSCAICADDCE